MTESSDRVVSLPNRESDVWRWEGGNDIFSFFFGNLLWWCPSSDTEGAICGCGEEEVSTFFFSKKRKKVSRFLVTTHLAQIIPSVKKEEAIRCFVEAQMTGSSLIITVTEVALNPKPYI